MSKKNGTKPERKPTAAEILARGGMTPEQIAQARLRRYAEDTAWNLFLAQFIIKAGVETWQRLQPDAPPELIQQWAEETLAAARTELEKAKKK